MLPAQNRISVFVYSCTQLMTMGEDTRRRQLSPVVVSVITVVKLEGTIHVKFPSDMLDTVRELIGKYAMYGLYSLNLGSALQEGQYSVVFCAEDYLSFIRELGINLKMDVTFLSSS